MNDYEKIIAQLAGIFQQLEKIANELTRFNDNNSKSKKK